MVAGRLAYEFDSVIQKKKKPGKDKILIFKDNQVKIGVSVAKISW